MLFYRAYLHIINITSNPNIAEAHFNLTVIFKRKRNGVIFLHCQNQGKNPIHSDYTKVMTVKPSLVIITHDRTEKLHMEAYNLFVYFKTQ